MLVGKSLPPPVGLLFVVRDGRLAAYTLEMGYFQIVIDG